MKAFVALQRVRLPPGKAAARQPEASLAWVAATPLVQRRQRIAKPGVEPRYHVRAGAFGVLGPRAASTGPQLARSWRCGRGVGTGQGYGMERQGTGEMPCVPTCRVPDRGRPADQGAQARSGPPPHRQRLGEHERGRACATGNRNHNGPDTRAQEVVAPS